MSIRRSWLRRVGKDGRLTLPKELRDRHGWGPGTVFAVENRSTHLTGTEVSFNSEGAPLVDMYGTPWGHLFDDYRLSSEDKYLLAKLLADLEAAAQALYHYERGDLGYAVDEAARLIAALPPERTPEDELLTVEELAESVGRRHLLAPDPSSPSPPDMESGRSGLFGLVAAADHLGITPEHLLDLVEHDRVDAVWFEADYVFHAEDVEALRIRREQGDVSLRELLALDDDDDEDYPPSIPEGESASEILPGHLDIDDDGNVIERDPID